MKIYRDQGRLTLLAPLHQTPSGQMALLFAAQRWAYLQATNLEVKRHFPPREIRFQFFLLLHRWFYPFRVDNNSRFSSWTLFQRNIGVYIKQRRSLRSTNETSCWHVQIPPKPVKCKWCKSYSTSKYGKSDPHLIIQLLSFWVYHVVECAIIRQIIINYTLSSRMTRFHNNIAKLSGETLWHLHDKAVDENV